VAGKPSLMQPDGIHPTAEGQHVVADNVFPALAKLLKRSDQVHCVSISRSLGCLRVLL
jgi:hypothetical protein